MVFTVFFYPKTVFGLSRSTDSSPLERDVICKHPLILNTKLIIFAQYLKLKSLKLNYYRLFRKFAVPLSHSNFGCSAGDLTCFNYRNRMNGIPQTVNEYSPFLRISMEIYLTPDTSLCFIHLTQIIIDLKIGSP